MEINVFMQKLQIKHKTCYIDQNGSDGPIILWGCSYLPGADGEAPAAFGDEDFKGNGLKTLQWLTNDLIPELKTAYGADREIYLIGYSLAGLFALWTAYETDIFSAIASCSGSLWFEQWDQYVSHHRIKHESYIYISLGGKEEKTKNQVMARVGDRTRKQEQILQNDSKVKKTILEFNSGGHFADSEKRLSKAVKWLLKNRKEQ